MTVRAGGRPVRDRRAPALVLALALGGLAACGDAPSKTPAPAASTTKVGSWTETGALNEARAGQTASLLGNGSVLVTGGQYANNVAVRTAEIFDPATGQWRLAATMNAARSGHTATVLTDGRVLVAGGVGLGSAEIFDPNTGVWTAAGTLAANRFGHTASLLANGKVIVVGGYSGPDTPGLTAVELYDPATNAWSQTGALRRGRGLHTATVLADGRVLVAGGNEAGANRRTAEEATTTSTTLGGLLSTGKGEITTAELYDPATATWDSTGSLRTARSAHTATLLKDGKVLVTGGFSPTGELDSAELYDPVAGTWAEAKSFAGPRTFHAAALLPDGKVLVSGGQVGNSGSVLSSTLSTAALYDPAAGTWARVTDLATPRTAHTETVLADGRLIVTGGLNAAGPVPNTEVFSPEAKP